MIKVAMVYSATLNSLNGASKVAKSFYDNQDILEQNGIKMDFFAPDVKENKLTEITGSSEWKPSRKKQIIHKIDIFGIIRTWYNINIRSEKIVVEFINKENIGTYDVIYVHELFTAYKLIKKIPNCPPIVFTLHTTGSAYSMLYSNYPLLKYTLFNNIYLKYIKNTIFNKVHRIVLNSELAKNNFVKWHTYLPERLSTFANNGIEDIELSSISKFNGVNKEVVCVGSVNERKGQRFIVEALKQAVCEGDIPNIHFTIVGDGTILQELKNICRGQNLGNYITFVGVQTNVLQYLKKADIFILPSVDEGQPIAIIEAMRSGLPVVSTPVGGIPFLVKVNENGILIEPSARGVYTFLKSCQEYDWNEMGRRSRELYEQEFTIQQMLKRYADIFKDEI